MHGPSPISTSEDVEVLAPSHRTADRVYQTMTIAAILLLLVSLWVF
jgi:hypothetical protein